jgi:HD-GYP domain-containing protein (c-di-GMP phosphodiesterase class II)
MPMARRSRRAIARANKPSQRAHWQQNSLIICERRFVDAIQHYKLAVEQISVFPGAAKQQCLGVVGGFVGDMLEEGELVIRLLSEGMGDKASMHPVNVTILSLLLGRSLGLPQSDMLDLGMAAFLHDIGKSRLPDRVRWPDENFSQAEYNLYQEHVAHGIPLGRQMDLTEGALQAIAAVSQPG